MSFLKPKVVMPPPMQPVAPVDKAPSIDDPDVTEAGEDAVAKTKKKTGRKDTILTSVMGDTSTAELSNNTLLGGEG